jgi:hypothetical protein
VVVPTTYPPPYYVLDVPLLATCIALAMAALLLIAGAASRALLLGARLEQFRERDV